MKDINAVRLYGTVVRDAEVRNLAPGAVVGNFTMVLSESYFDREEKSKTRTSYVRVNVWNELATRAEVLCRKGAHVYCEGKLESRSWDDKKSGQKRFALEVVAFALNDQPSVSKNAEAKPKVTGGGVAAARAVLSPPLTPTF